MSDGMGDDGGSVAGAERFYARRFGKVGVEGLRELLRESGEWKYGELVLITRTREQLLEIYQGTWHRVLGEANGAKRGEFGTLPGPYPRALPSLEETEAFISYRWSPSP